VSDTQSHNPLQPPRTAEIHIPSKYGKFSRRLLMKLA
jgi:hypothetical protein